MNAAVKDILVCREHPSIGETAMWLSHAVEVLATATLSWSVLPPTSVAELDSIGHQLEGLRRSLGDLRTAMQK